MRRRCGQGGDAACRAVASCRAAGLTYACPAAHRPPPAHPSPAAQQSLELYRQLGALLGSANRHLSEAGWDWAATGVLRRAFDWNVRHLAAAYARVRPSLLHLPAVDV